MNKVETRVELIFNVHASTLLSNTQKGRITAQLKNRINSAGELVIACEAYKSQLRNKEEAERLFYELLKKALTKPKKRKPTRPGRAAKERRLKGKKIQSEKKKGRGKPDLD